MSDPREWPDPAGQEPATVTVSIPSAVTLVAASLFCFLATAKLTGAVDWSWWWICTPLIILAVFIAMIAASAGVLLWAASRQGDTEW